MENVMVQKLDLDRIMTTLYCEGDQDEWLAFVSMCKARGLDALVEARKAIQARYDTMLAE